MTRQLRLVVFSQSIISDISNPQATTVRAICQAFADAGHDVTHLEESGNPALMRMLTSRGYAPMRAFNERYPHIRYRRYALLSGSERAVWFGREIATADAVVAYPGTPEGVIAELKRWTAPNVIRVWDEAVDDALSLLALWTEPAVLVRTASSQRPDNYVAAYDNVLDIDRPGWTRISVGSAMSPDWEFIPEVLVEDRYQRSQTVAMDAREEMARILLPVANGATTELVNGAGEIVRHITTVPAEHDARKRAQRLATEIDRLLAERIAPRR